MNEELLTRIAVLETENNDLRQVLKDLHTWIAEGFLLIADEQKIRWEKKYKALQQQTNDLLGEKVP